jgi:hypothetical protein
MKLEGPLPAAPLTYIQVYLKGYELYLLGLKTQQREAHMGMKLALREEEMALAKGASGG